MIPVITINHIPLTISQVRLLRKLILQYIAFVNDVLWDQVETNDQKRGVFPYLRIHAYAVLETMEGLRPAEPHYPEGNFGVYVTINGTGLKHNESDTVRMVLCAEQQIPLTPEEKADHVAMVRAVFAKANI